MAKRAATREYQKKTKLVMMEDITEGKGPERHYRINTIDIGDRVNKWDDWMWEIMSFLKESVLPEDRVKARKIRLKAAGYAIVGNILYRKSFSEPLLRCLMKDDADEVLSTIHSGVCGNHSGGWSLAHKVITVGYF